MKILFFSAIIIVLNVVQNGINSSLLIKMLQIIRLGLSLFCSSPARTERMLVMFPGLYKLFCFVSDDTLRSCLSTL